MLGTPSSSRRFGGLRNVLFGGRAGRRLARWSRQLAKIASHESEFKALSDDDLRKHSLSLRYEAKSGVPLAKLLAPAFALAREAGWRTLKMRHFDVQAIGGISLFNESIAEMATGEGKTLTATLPLYLYALVGKGAHLATVNDYLAKRDAEWMSPLYEMLGMTVGIIESDTTREDRWKAYSSDITYGTGKEFGFDFLRDQLLLRQLGDEEKAGIRKSASTDISKEPIAGEPFFVLIDEADSVLIDEARTPLIIGAFDERRREQLAACYQWAAVAVGQYKEVTHYKYDHEKKKVELNGSGRELMRTIPTPKIMNAVGLLELYEFTERAIKVQRDFRLDREYVVRDGEIVIVDEFTGRLAEGRKWRDGIHQAIEAKEKVEVTVGTGQAARITVQDLFMRYEHMAGMTGTATTSAREFKKVYKHTVVPIPTNRPIIRKRLPERVFAKSDDKWLAIVQEVKEIHEQGRPVLIGTKSIDRSQYLSKLLIEAGIQKHAVLNAHQVAEEAMIVAQAGRVGAVTIATNMAGRGTDIILGGNSETLALMVLQRQGYQSRLQVPRELWEETVQRIEEHEKMEQQGASVRENGGLHVICSELHDSLRVDRQLMGRSGRQGDPGTVRQYLALEDDIIRSGFGPKRAKRIRARNGKGELGQTTAKLLQTAQHRVEREHLRQRILLNYHEQQRKKMFTAMGQNPYLDVPQ